MKKKILSILLAVCLLAGALPMAASAEDDYEIKFDHTSYETIVQSAKEGAADSPLTGHNSGFLYDLDGDGVKELVLTYESKIHAVVGCLYTKVNGQVKPLLENEVLVSLLHSYGYEIGLMSKNGRNYFGIKTSSGYNTYYGDINLYTLKNGKLSLSSTTKTISGLLGNNTFEYGIVVDGKTKKVSKEEYDAIWNSAKPIITTGKTGESDQGKDFKSLLAEVKAYEASNVAGFDDVYETDYYAGPVEWAVNNGITSGIAAAAFGPKDSCTRAQAVTFLWRAAGEQEPQNTDTAFTDVKPGAYYEKAVQWAVENGITAGAGNGKFDPNGKCTRAQIVTFLYRAQGQPEIAGNNSFQDVKAGAYYENAVKWAVGNEITSGTGGNKFSPEDNCSRGQIVTFLYRNYAE